MNRIWAIVLLVLSHIAVASDDVPKDIVTFTTGMTKEAGFVTFYYDFNHDKIYLEIEQFDQPFIFQTSLPRGIGSNDIGLDRGQLGDTRLVEFERYGNKVMLKQLNTQYRASANNQAEKQSIEEAFASSVLAGFEIVATLDGRVLVDYTSYLLSDVHGVAQRLSKAKQGQYTIDTKRSGVFQARSKSFALNTELEAMVTFGGQAQGQYIRDVSPSPDSVTVHLHHSFVALPDDNYTPRAFHPYSGFWKHSYFDYSTAIDQPMEQKYIVRHRLSKVDPSATKSKAVEPIVYYLDPGIPEPVFSALKDGASWWNQAFEAAGYDNAFQVKVLPDDADPMDVRYNVIQWVHRATRGWSYGTSVVDPRTGELIKGHVTLGSLRVRQDYLIATGVTSPHTTKSADTSKQKAMALARIRQLSAHEVGHTLGIAHNFAASEDDRASVMDYPHPKFVMKNGKVQLDDAYDTGIGEWDKHVIAYGYQDYANAEQETQGLESQILTTLDKGMKYKSDPDSRAARHGSSDGHLWDNGADPIKEFARLSKIRSYALDNMGLNTLAEGESLSSLEAALVPVYLLHRYQLDAVAKQLAGVEYRYEVKGDSREAQGVKPVAGKVQKQALKALIDASTPEYLALPKHITTLITPNVYGEDITREHFVSRTGRTFDPVSAAESAADYSLRLALHPERLNRLIWQSSQARQIPSVEQVINRIFEVHWYSKPQDYGLTKRLQLVALNAVVDAASNPNVSPEVKLAIQGELIKFENWLAKDDRNPAHKVLLRYFAEYWDLGVWPGKFIVKPLPPGSPI